METSEITVSKGGWFSRPVIFKKDLTGQVIVITGSNQGIGKETARSLAKTGATIILACRDPKKALNAVEELKADTKNSNIEFMKLDLSDLKSIKDFTNEFKNKYHNLNILINNAAVFVSQRTVTKDGFEAHWGTNHLGLFYLTTLLLDVIKSSGPSRIINVSSAMVHLAKMNWDDLNYENEKEYSMFKAYGQSKLAGIMFTKELQRRLDSEGAQVKVVAADPGGVNTNIHNNENPRWYEKIIAKGIQTFGASPADGAKTNLYCALEDFEKLQGGGFYVDSKIGKVTSAAELEENWAKVWSVSETMLKSKI